jgi:hypothetical protein
VTDLEKLTTADFEPLVHQCFRVDPGNQPPFEVELVEVTEILREPGGRAPFSLEFEGGPSPPLPQRIYRVEHDGLGAFEIFLIPIADGRYEAVFT